MKRSFAAYALAASLLVLAGCDKSDTGADGTDSGIAMNSSAMMAAEDNAAKSIAGALADPGRADQAGDDERRKAAESIQFSGVEAGDSVIDYIPGSGYWTRIFTRVVGPKGHVYAIWPGSGGDQPDALTALKGRNLGNVTAETLAPDAALPAPVDLFWTVQNYHDIANKGGEAALNAFNARVFKALKPGGTYVVIDHAARDGSGLADTNTLHRIDPQAVMQEVTAAGFVFAGSSEALKNPEDDHTKKVFDPAIRGRTDQFIYKFRKPG